MRIVPRLLVLTALCAGMLPGPCLGDGGSRLRGAVWVQPVRGFSVGDDLVAGRVGSQISISDIPLLGTVNATVPIEAEVTFNDPAGILVGGELVLGRFGVEVDFVYLQDAAIVNAGVDVCGGLLSEGECALLELGSFLVPGLALPDRLGLEERLDNAAITLGANFHLLTNEKWDLWVGPMAIWSMWDEYDFSDVRIRVRTSVESLLEGEVGDFELSNYADLAPESAMTFGAILGGRYAFAPRWHLMSQFRYCAGDDLDLPGGSGRYRVAGFSLGVSYRVRG